MPEPVVAPVVPPVAPPVVVPPVVPPAPTDWRGGLAEDLRGEKSLETIKGKDWTEAGPVLAKGYVEAQKLVGGSVRIPATDAKPEEWGKFYDKLGRPAAPDKYEIVVPEALVPVFDKASNDGFRKASHDLGLTPKQAQGLIDWYGAGLTNANSVLKTTSEQATAELRQTWGAAFDKNLALARRAVVESGGKELIDYLDLTGLGNHPALIRAWAKVGALLAEDGTIPEAVEGSLTGVDAKAKIASVMADPNHLYHAKNVDKPGHAEAVKEVQGLFQIAYPQM